MPGKLVGLSGKLAGRVYWIDTLQPVVLGRLEGNDIVLAAEPSVSARHAMVFWTSPHFTVKDLGSANGTQVNGQPALGPTPLRDGDCLQLGDVQFQFAVEVQPQPVDPRPLTAPPPADFPAGYPALSPYGPPPGQPVPYEGAPKDKVVAGILAICLGCLGVHHFYMNRTGRGLAMLLPTLLTCGWAAVLTAPIGLVQGILYLVSTDREFQQKYLEEGRIF